jgi:hypothetical protein
MSASKKPALPTAVEIRAQIDEAEQELTAANAALGEALFAKVAVPDRDVGPEHDAVNAARRRIDGLQAVLPLMARAEAQALAETRARLAEEQRKRLERALGALLKHSMYFSVHYQNAASAFRRMTAAGTEAARLLFDGQKQIANGGLVLRLSAHGLKALADQEINRIGLLPALHGDGEASAPGTNPTAVDLRLSNAPHQLPALEAEIRRLTALIMASAPEPQESRKEERLPKVAVAEVEGPPTGCVEAPARSPTGKAA